MLTGRVAIAHLCRRAGFGLAPADEDSWYRLDYKAAVQRLLDALPTGEVTETDPQTFDPYQPGAIQQAWLERMLGGKAPLAEKLALFWHGHFATSNTKIQEPALMWRQYQLLRAKGGGRFDALLGAISRDVAMIRWLDGNANRKGAANENYARELQELFSLGIGNYTEHDVREIARAFTGWGSKHHDFVFTEAFHDGGSKTFHGKTGRFGGDDVVRILAALPACHRFLATKLLRFFVHPQPAVQEINDLAEVLARTGGDMRAALFVLFMSPSFRARRNYRALVKSPIEFLVGALRAVGSTKVELWGHGALERMGQILFRPPSVKGWTRQTGWLGSAAVVERLRVAQRLGRTFAKSADTIARRALDDNVPQPLATLLTAKPAARQVALVLASPAYQLA